MNEDAPREPAQARRQGQERLRDVPTAGQQPAPMSSATVRRAGCESDSTISPTHLPSVAGRPASGRYLQVSSATPATWEPGARRHLRTPFRPPQPTRTRNSSLLYKALIN